MRIIVFADIHYFAGDIENAIFNKHKKLVQYALPILDKLTDKINEEHKADLAVNLGDIIQDTTERDADINALKFMFDRLKRIKCRCVSILGNHDLKMMDSVEEVEAIMGEKSTLSFDMDGWHLVFLTTEVRPELGTERGGCYKAHYLSDKTMEWLASDLDSNTLPCLIFTHYTLAEDETQSDECMFMKNRSAVKEIIRKHPEVKAVFSGHRHVSKILVEDGIPHHLIGSPIANSEIPNKPLGVYNEIELTANALKVTEHHISI